MWWHYTIVSPYTYTWAIAELSIIGGFSSSNGRGGRIHFHWSDIPTGDVYQPVASVKVI